MWAVKGRRTFHASASILHERVPNHIVQELQETKDAMSAHTVNNSMITYESSLWD